MSVEVAAEPQEPQAAREASVDLALTGMTCATCATRIERKLNRLPGVAASVNFATEQATVRYPATVDQADLLAAVAAAGYRATPIPAPGEDRADEGPGEQAQVEAAAAERGPARELLDRLRISALLAAPVILLGMVPVLQFRNWQWFSLMLAAPVVVWGAWPFHRAAAANLRHRAVTMDTLVSLGVLAAFGWSLYALFLGGAGQAGMTMPFTFRTDRSGGADHIYLEAATGVTVFLLAGRYLEARAKRRSGAALRALLELGAKEVAVLRGGAERLVPVGELAVGDLFVVRPGEKVATDGVVVDGASAIDAGLLTGESTPIEVRPGDPVTGATINAGGRLTVRATRIGADTQLARIGRLVTSAQTGKAEAQRLADRVAAFFVPLVLLLSLGTGLVWLAVDGGAGAAFTAAVAVLIIACPCALGLATPTALLVGTGRGAQLGILIKGPEVLESTRRIDTVVLDKTGTVTTGRMSLIAVVPAEGENAEEALGLAGAVEHASQHPIARAVARAAAERAGALADVRDFAALDGIGVTGTVADRQVLVGRPALLAGSGLSLPRQLADAVAEAESAGRTAVVVGWSGAARAVLVVADTVKPTSAQAVAELRALGLDLVLLTGDGEGAARAVAAQVGIDEVIAGVLPAGKADAVRRLQAAGRVVAMVGDGANDAAALAQADLGLAMGTGTDAAIEAGDLTLVRGDLRSAADAIRLSRRTLAVIKGNLFWAFAYNVAAIPLAALGLLNPVIAGAAMASSSVFVVSNSLRLRGFQARAAEAAD
ncbi:MAG TPA: heavy metal translocating P-type ATPase [Actinocrinis sp.]|nr:heavy metal translocating P-type ATPase [Actinocrinis sp.]